MPCLWAFPLSIEGGVPQPPPVKACLDLVVEVLGTVGPLHFLQEKVCGPL